MELDSLKRMDVEKIETISASKYGQIKTLELNNNNINIQDKIKYIVKEYFNNIFNQKFICDAYNFIEQTELLDLAKAKQNNLPQDFFFIDKFIFEEIRSIYLTFYNNNGNYATNDNSSIHNNSNINRNIVRRRNKLKSLNSTYTKAASFASKTNNNIDLVYNPDVENPKFQYAYSNYYEFRPPIESKFFKYSNNVPLDDENNIFIKHEIRFFNREKKDNEPNFDPNSKTEYDKDDFNQINFKDDIKINHDQESLTKEERENFELKEEEQKRMSFIENKRKEMLNILNEHLKLEELSQIYRILQSSKCDEALKEEFFLANKLDKKLFKFEENLFYYFKNLIKDKDSYTKIACKDFDLSYKLIDKVVLVSISKEMTTNLVDLIALIYENSFYPLWFPFVKKTETLIQPNKAKKLIYMLMNFPLISDRDFLVYGFGLNNIREEGSIYLLVQSIGQNTGIFGDDFKSKENKKFVRADINIFGFEIKHLGNNKIVMNGVVNCDPKISFMPKWLINSILKQFAKNLFSKLVTIAKNYRGSKYENKNPSLLDQLLYEFIRSESLKYFGYS